MKPKYYKLMKIGLITKIEVLWRNWPVHNLIAHPISELVHWITCWFCGSKVSGWVHDITIPRDVKNGRG